MSLRTLGRALAIGGIFALSTMMPSLSFQTPPVAPDDDVLYILPMWTRFGSASDEVLAREIQVYGKPRPDIAAKYEKSDFANSGYEVVASQLPPGAYRLVATAHTAATGTFSLSQTVDIVVSEAR